VQPLWDHMSLNTLMDMNTWGKCGLDETKFRYGMLIQDVIGRCQICIPYMVQANVDKK
jgi:hypothetical protein